MAIDPEKFKQDRRTPADLAKAILDHEFTPPRPGRFYGQTFREALWENYNCPWEPKHLTDVLLPLKYLEADVPLTAKEKRSLTHALQLIDDYRRSAAKRRDEAEIQANPHMPSKNRTQQAVSQVDRDLSLHGPHAHTLQRQGQEEMEQRVLELSNLNGIEKLLRALAHKCGSTLVEPGHRR